MLIILKRLLNLCSMFYLKQKERNYTIQSYINNSKYNCEQFNHFLHVMRVHFKYDLNSFIFALQKIDKNVQELNLLCANFIGIGYMIDTELNELIKAIVIKSQADEKKDLYEISLLFKQSDNDLSGGIPNLCKNFATKWNMKVNELFIIAQKLEEYKNKIIVAEIKLLNNNNYDHDEIVINESVESICMYISDLTNAIR